MRADQLLVARGLAVSRAQAQRLIAAGAEWQASDGAWHRVAKNGQALQAQTPVRVLDDAERRYVSRGGLKLDGALRHTGLDIQGRVCLDVGQSTGGFTDVLLRAGAARVVGIDVGHGQLHESLRTDNRVLAFEGVNARSPEDIKKIANSVFPMIAGGGFDLICVDLSFISLVQVLPALAGVLAAQGDALLLVKPQFELGPKALGKGGLVRDVRRYAEVLERIHDAARAIGWRPAGTFDSAITGGDGNREFFVHARRAP